jgi:hypothetical protein
MRIVIFATQTKMLVATSGDYAAEVPSTLLAANQ